MFVTIDSIVIGERIRQDKGKDWEQFLQSFPKLGQLQPIRVDPRPDGKWDLNTGWRRLTAIKIHHEAGTKIPRLQPGMIEIAQPDEDVVPVHTRLIREFAENNDRADFNFMEKARFTPRFHETMVAAMGEDAWPQELTAHSLNLSPASISHYLRIEEASKTDASVGKAATLDAAVKRMKVTEKLAKRVDEVKREDTGVYDRANAILAHDDARNWIATIEAESVDLVNFDPPWGDNASHKSAENHEQFDDSSEYAESLMASLLPQIYRVLRPDRFCIFWHRLWATERMAALAESHGFNLQFVRTPCIWYKPDKVSDQNRFPEKQLIDAYEPFFLLRKGDPVFHERYTHNVFAFDRVPLGQIVHPTEKPVSLCEAIIKLCTVPGECVLDPTAGSSAFIDQALRSNRKAKGCELSPEFHTRGIARLTNYLKTFADK